MIYSCGCENEIDPQWGVLRSISKCPQHTSNQVPTSIRYYDKLGCFDSECMPTKSSHQIELLKAIGCLEIELNSTSSTLLEIGCGVGTYVTLFLSRGFKYSAIEPCHEAAQWVHSVFNVEMYCGLFEDFAVAEREQYNMIFSAHTVEHFVDSPAMLMKIHRLLTRPGRLLLIVPDDSDPLNPDHMWFYNDASLRHVLELIGFIDIRIYTQDNGSRENYIYCAARKSQG